MGRRTFPRPSSHHQARAAEIIRGFATKCSWIPSLPIPIERIVEEFFELTIESETIPEDPGVIILGLLDPGNRRICFNDAHTELFERVIGPYEFTLAHETAHWVYDAINPDQLSFALDVPIVRCIGSASDEVTRIREMNANKLAAELLMPHELVRGALPSEPLSRADFARLAAGWGVSKTTLGIRLKEMAREDLLPG